jgi:two-component sensor histidine kinase
VPDSWLARETNRLPPNSLRACAFAVVCVAVATMVRFAAGWLGVDVPFATYFPAVLIVAVLAGPAAAALAVALSGILAWWLFLPPYFRFAPLTFSDAMNLGLFALSALCIVYAAQKYRAAVQRLRDTERQRQLELRELEHRGKNTFAVVESIVRKTLEDQPDQADLIAGRIHAVSSTNDIINRSEGHIATLDSILTNEFAPYDLSRLDWAGPRIELPADTARAMALVIHELITNAAKYGALAAPTGRVNVRWTAEGRGVALDWIEAGGPQVQTPADYGFGSRLVVRTLQALSGSVEPHFDPAGLKCRIAFRM